MAACAMRRGLAAGVAAICVAAGGAALAQDGAAGEKPRPRESAPLGCTPRRSSDRIDSVTERGELRLASGRVAKLAGIRRPDGPPQDGAAAAFLEGFRGAAVAVAALADEPDRWGRLPAIVEAESEGGPLDLGRGLVAAGLALVDAGEADRLCQPGLLAAEARARAFRLGLWRDDGYKPVAASDLDTLVRRIGRFALVEGRIRSVGERARRTYLNFGADWSRDLTITIPQRVWASLRERGVSAASLRGRRVRARGLVEEWRGPAITIMAPEMLEILDEDIPRRRP